MPYHKEHRSNSTSSKGAQKWPTSAVMSFVKKFVVVASSISISELRLLRHWQAEGQEEESTTTAASFGVCRRTSACSTQLAQDKKPLHNQNLSGYCLITTHMSQGAASLLPSCLVPGSYAKGDAFLSLAIRETAIQ